MCGIYAISCSQSIAFMQERMQPITHRGPDNRGFHIGENFSFAHNRLSVIDLDVRSNQPFEYQGYTITFNGEIYNYSFIKEELLSKGYCFTTNSDTEVLLAAYIEYGSNVFDRLNGMFSFVIHDPVKNVLFGARDRLGKKPLFYRHSLGKIEIASQVSQFVDNKDEAISQEAINSYFKYKYISTPNSIRQSIKKLSAGNYFQFSLENGAIQISEYYNLAKNLDPRKKSFVDSVNQLDRLLNESIELRRTADVPVGVFLSGGIDSSLVASICQRQSTEKINTYCVKIDSKGFDESAKAEKVADYIGSNHTTITCRPNDVIETMLDYANCFDEPFADSSLLPTMLLCKVVRRHVTVALSGDGADESFLGYNRYRTLNRLKTVFGIPYSIRKLVKLLPNGNGISKYSKALKLIELKDASEFYHQFLQGHNQKYLYDDPSLNSTLYADYLVSSDSLVKSAALYDTFTYLPDDINVKVDRASMYSSLEVRSPFLDYKLVEFGASLPVEYLIKDGVQKYILRELSKKYVPRSLVNQPKSGFSLPIGYWLKNEMREFVQENLRSSDIRKIPGIDHSIAEKLIKDHMEGVGNYQSEIFKLLGFTLWMKKWC